MVGEPFEELTIAEMVQVQGSGDVQVETTPACLYSVYVTANVSSVWCAGATVGAVISIVKC
ncbi:type 2 lantibiotic [Lactococcus lactis]|nr:type 2 lantibiotic [Lactococcus lactis]